MDYGDFKRDLLKEVQNFYGRDAEVEFRRIRKNNGQSYEGIYIAMKGRTHNVVPAVEVDYLYEAYREGQMNMDDCVEAVYRTRERYECPEELVRFTENITDWEAVKRRIYPALLPAKENRELLEGLVSVSMLDLSVVYTIRCEMGGEGIGSIKISRHLLDCYGISVSELHCQALENMKDDGYCFREMTDLLREDFCGNSTEFVPYHEMKSAGMYILTNALKIYGSAGFLDKSLIRGFAGNRDFYILPSSVHETIFIPAEDDYSREELDALVSEVNELCVAKEDRLSDHSYYYDAKKNEIRILK